MSLRNVSMDKARMRSVLALRAWTMLEELAMRVVAGATDAELMAEPCTRSLIQALEMDGDDGEARLIRMLREYAAPTTDEGKPNDHR